MELHGAIQRSAKHDRTRSHRVVAFGDAEDLAFGLLRHLHILWHVIHHPDAARQGNERGTAHQLLHCASLAICLADVHDAKNGNSGLLGQLHEWPECSSYLAFTVLIGAGEVAADGIDDNQADIVLCNRIPERLYIAFEIQQTVAFLLTFETSQKVDSFRVGTMYFQSRFHHVCHIIFRGQQQGIHLVGTGSIRENSAVTQRGGKAHGDGALAITGIATEQREHALR